jgi:hypothetical protein
MRDRQRLRILHGQNDVIPAFVASVRIHCADKSFLMALCCFHIYRELSNWLFLFLAPFQMALVIEKTLPGRLVEIAAEKRDNQCA